MKELSIEEKAKAYDEAVINGSRLWECGEITRESYEYIFPELKENEDAEIRKEMITYLSTVEDKELIPYERWIAWLEKQSKLMKALQISNARIGELIEKNYCLKEQFEKQREHDMGISEATKQKLEDSLNKALEKETPESWNEFIEKQSELDKDSEDEKIRQFLIHEVAETSDKVMSYRNMNKKDVLAWLEKQAEQKPAWSEEDEARFESCIEVLQTSDGYDTINAKWLKSLKERVQSLPKQEWSEEDEKMLNACTELIGNTICANYSEEDGVTTDACRDWLKSLKDRYTWKPSDEQIIELRRVISGCSYDIEPLAEMEEQLKKLRGE